MLKSIKQSYPIVTTISVIFCPNNWVTVRNFLSDSKLFVTKYQYVSAVPHLFVITYSYGQNVQRTYQLNCSQKDLKKAFWMFQITWLKNLTKRVKMLLVNLWSVILLEVSFLYFKHQCRKKNSYENFLIYIIGGVSKNT